MDRGGFILGLEKRPMPSGRGSIARAQSSGAAIRDVRPRRFAARLKNWARSRSPRLNLTKFFARSTDRTAATTMMISRTFAPQKRAMQTDSRNPSAGITTGLKKLKL